ncbi:MAG TPA: hypothetical protein DDW52_21685 [Planctomycetaceae bacterium]|nr:hypothetical protein [Planctomycetaceae bacterium]
MAVSAADVAKAAGVSRGLVGKVLNNVKGNIGASEETRRRVIEAANRLGYRPNAAAQATRSGKSKNIGYVVVGAEPGYPLTGSSAVSAAICEELNGDGYRLMYSYANLKAISEGQLPDVMRYIMVDGLILDRSGRSHDDLYEASAELNLPFIVVNDRHPTNSIYPDDFDAARSATSKLIERGHRKIAYLGYLEKYESFVHYSLKDRCRGYVACMQDAGLAEAVHQLPSPIFQEYSSSVMDRARELKSLLLGDSKPTAFVAQSSQVATDLILAASSLGLAIPNDLSVVTINRDTTVPLAGGVAISAMHWDDYRLGAQAGRMILDRLTDPSADLVSVPLKASWIEGATIARLPPR